MLRSIAQRCVSKHVAAPWFETRSFGPLLTMRRREASARFPKFVIQGSTLLDEFRKAKGTSKFMFLVPLFDLKFLIEFAASDAGSSNRRH